MVISKKGEGMSMAGTIGAFVLIIFLIVGLAYLYFNTQGSGSGTFGALSVSKNALTVELCNGYCEKMMGENVVSIGGLVGGGVEGSKYSFCTEERDFIFENDRKEEMSCSEVAKSGKNIGIREDCPC